MKLAMYDRALVIMGYLYFEGLAFNCFVCL